MGIICHQKYFDRKLFSLKKISFKNFVSTYHILRYKKEIFYFLKKKLKRFYILSVLILFVFGNCLLIISMPKNRKIFINKASVDNLSSREAITLSQKQKF